MATTTTNYGLTKPSYGDNADIAVINSNMDKIDAKMKEIEDAGGSGASTWADVANKPFETVGSGLSVDESGALNATGGGSGGSSVSWNQIQTSGAKIAEVTIDGTKTDVYAPTGGSGGGSGGGSSVRREILYTATEISRTDIELSKPYTDFDYLDITILKYDDGSYYDFMHTFIDCAQQADIMNNNLFTGRTNSNIIDIWATANSFMRYKFTDATHITYPAAGGSCAIYCIKGIKF